MWAVVALASTNFAVGFTPKSPEVRQIIDDAMSFLDSTRETLVGGKFLIGVVYIKENRFDHPHVQAALEAAKTFVQQERRVLLGRGDTYTLALAAMFLCEYDADLYRSEIEKLLSVLWERQLDVGAWTYGGNVSKGDTSQSQYAVLCCWTAFRMGFEVPPKAVVEVCQWLMRTQDESGGFGYQPLDPGPDKPRRKQTEIRESVTVAGLGSLYICSTMLGMNPMLQKSDGTVQQIPAAFVPVLGRGEGSLGVQINRGLANEVRRTMNEGNRWFQANYSIAPADYTYYYLYSLERYQAFRALAEGKSESEPAWYNEGVRWLSREQAADGSWPASNKKTGKNYDVCFAVLFLQRNTQRSISKSEYGEGLLVGGRGLPSNTRRIRMVDGRVVSALERRSVTALARVLSDPNSPDFEALKLAGETLLIDPNGTTEEDKESLRRLAVSGDERVRMLAVRALATQRDLDNVSTFIAVLGSDDSALVREARDALRQVSRKFQGFGLSNAPTTEQKEAAKRAWKKWYLEIRPNESFDD